MQAISQGVHSPAPPVASPPSPYATRAGSPTEFEIQRTSFTLTDEDVSRIPFPYPLPPSQCARSPPQPHRWELVRREARRCARRWSGRRRGRAGGGGGSPLGGEVGEVLFAPGWGARTTRRTRQRASARMACSPRWRAGLPWSWRPWTRWRRATTGREPLNRFSSNPLELSISQVYLK